MKTCNTCLMDESDSTITFNSRGVCVYCENFENNIAPSWKPDSQGEAVLSQNAEKIRKDGLGREFDCIMGLSGGLDSSYCAHVAVNKMGLRPLLFHVDGGWNTDQAVGNIEKIVDGLGLDLYTEVINWKEMKSLQRSFLQSQVPHQDIPQDTAFFSALYRFAAKNKIKYVLTGSNHSTECIREPEEWGAYPGTDATFIKGIHKAYGKDRLKTFPIVDVFTSKLYYERVLGMKVFKPLNYVPFVKQEAEVLLAQEYGWEPFQHKHFESRFTRFLEDFWLPRKFGIDRRKAHFSSLILTGQMTREEGSKRIESTELPEEFLQKEFDYIARKLDFSPAQLWDIFHGENKTATDYPNKLKMIYLAAWAQNQLGAEKRLYK